MRLLGNAATTSQFVPLIAVAVLVAAVSATYVWQEAPARAEPWYAGLGRFLAYGTLCKVSDGDRIGFTNSVLIEIERASNDPAAARIAAARRELFRSGYREASRKANPVDLDCPRVRSIFAFEVGPRAIANAKALVELSQADDLQLGNGGRPRISTLRVD